MPPGKFIFYWFSYAPGTPYSFAHVYRYDADNRIKEVYTQRAGESAYKEAAYFYYPHGPLSRIEIGEDIVQGLDYAYTLQGWQKSINPDIEANAGIDAHIPNDAFMYTLGYHHSDYAPIEGDFPDFLALDVPQEENIFSRYGTQAPKYRGLFNGNIAYTMNAIAGLDRSPESSSWQLNEYSYDQLNRLTKSRGFAPLWNPEETGPDVLGYTPTYRTAHKYDANGNMTQLVRTAWHTGSSSYEQMDSLVYHYEQESGRLKNNRLLHVNDLQSNASLFTEDIDDQGTYTDKETSNYRYDKTGNLSKDVSEGIDTIIWNAYGKIRAIRFNNGKPDLTFVYDAAGSRIAKLVHSTTDNSKIEKGDIYWRDAQGNPLSIEQYATVWEDEEQTPVYEPLSQLNSLEYPVYGSGRLGMRTDTLTATPIADFISTRGWRHYELSNHLGNVQVTLGDYIQGDDDNNPEAEVYSSQDYYGFGMVMPGRSYTFTGNSSLNRYRFGFNGMENVDEVSGRGNHIDFGARGYHPRRGQFLSIDPLSSKFPHESNYSFAGNSPIFYIDNKGERKTVYLTVIDESTGDKTVFKKVVSDEMMQIPRKQKLTILGLYWDGRTEETVHDWYDIDMNVTLILHKDGSESRTLKLNQGNYRTTTNGPSMAWANKKLNIADTYNGLLNGNTKENYVPAGYVLTSIKGGHSESYYNKRGSHIYGAIDIDGLLTTLGAANSATNSLSTNTKSMLKLAPDVSSKLKSFADKLSNIISTTDLGFSVQEALGLEGLYNEPIDSCTYCGAVQPRSLMRKDGYHTKTVEIKE